MKKNMKKALCYLLTAGMLAGNVLPAAAEESAVLIAKYDFENVTGTTVPNAAEGADGFEGTLSGSNVSIEEDTALGNSLKFTEGTEGHMLVEGILNTGTTSYSISMWYQYDTSADRNNKNAVLLQQGGGGRTLLTLTPENKYHTYINTSDVYSTGAVNADHWQHVILVNDAANQKVKFYVNGELDSEKDAGSGKVNELTSLFIGRHKNGGTDPQSMRGLVDEICVYEGMITDAQAKEIHEEKADLVTSPEEPETPGEEVVITLDPEEVERTLDDSIFGINHRYAFNGYGSFDSYLMEVKEDFRDLYEDAGFGSIRYPGGTISNLYNWKTTLDAVGRKNQIHGFYNNPGQGGIAPNFGIKEIADFSDAAGTEIVYVYSLGRGSVQDAQDLIEFFNAEVGTNPNGGVDWAAVRAQSGHPEPYNVRYFEIGNEMQQVYADGTSSQGYWLHGVPNAEDGYIEGGTATFTQQYAVCEEDWNAAASRSDGSPNLVRYMRYANVNPKICDENGRLVDDPEFMAVKEHSVSVFVENEQWTIVENFENSAASDKHVVVDYSTAALIFGDGVKGAIPAAGSQIKVSYSVERDGMVDIARAMKETTEAINEAEGTDYEALIYSSYETHSFITKMTNRGYNDLYDGLTIHPYSGTPSGTGGAFYDSAMSLAERTGIGRVNEYVDMLPEGKVPVISEFGIFRSTDPLLRSQTHAVYIAKVMMEYVRLGSPYIQKHCLIDWYSSGADSLGPTQQAVIQAVPQSGASTATGEGEFKFFSTPSAHVFQMFNSSFGDEVIASSVSRTETLSSGTAAYSVLGSKDRYDNYYAAIVNADREQGKAIKLVVDGVDLTGKNVEIQLLASENFADENTLEDPDRVAVETTAFVSEDSAVSVEIPKHAVMTIKVSAGVDKTKLEKVLEEAKDVHEEDYTEASWNEAKLEAVIEAGEAVLENSAATDEEAAEALVALQSAMEVLVYKTARKTELKEKIEEAGSLSEEEYTGSTWADLQQILSAAKNVAGKENASQELVDKVLADLTEKMEALKKIIPLSVMTVTAGNSHDANQGPDAVTDNNNDTKWHTDWYGTSRENHYLQFELEEEYVVDGLCYLPRQDSSSNGVITEYEILISRDGENWTEAAEGNWASNKEWKFAEFEGQSAKYIRFISVNSMSDSSYVFASAAEVRLTGKLPGEEEEKPEVCEVFSDVPHGAWYEDYVQYVYDNGLMAGNNGLFNPVKNVTRAQLVTTLYRMAGEPEVTDDKALKDFSDVAEEQYYTEAVCWAYNIGVGTGNDGKFNPAGTLTRQQMAAFLYRFAKVMDYDTAQRKDYSDMLNADQVSSYAEEAVSWAAGAGLISGSEVKNADGTVSYDLKPRGNTTRAQLSAILQRFCEVNKIED